MIVALSGVSDSEKTTLLNRHSAEFVLESSAEPEQNANDFLLP